MPKIASHDDRMPGLCPLCGGRGAKLIAALRPCELHQCDGCGHRFIDLSSLPGDLESLYGSEYAGYRSDPLFQAAIREEIASNFIPRISPPRRILDVGCGNGEFIAAAQEAGYIAIGIDISETAVTLCRDRGLSAQVGDFVAVEMDGEFDFITMWDVIEHLPDPKLFVQRAFELLRPGGYLVIYTPYNTDRTVRVVRRFPRLAKGLLHVYTHIQFFDQQTLGMLLQENGFARFDWLKARKMRSPSPARSTKRTIARLIVKMFRFYGQDSDLYVMARKPL